MSYLYSNVKTAEQRSKVGPTERSTFCPPQKSPRPRYSARPAAPSAASCTPQKPIWPVLKWNSPVGVRIGFCWVVWAADAERRGRGGVKEIKRKGASACVLTVWLKRCSSGGHPVTSESPGDHHLCGRRRSQRCPLGAPDPILWLTDTARSNPEPAYYWWHLRNAEQELQEDPGERVSCDELFFKLRKELNGRHDDAGSSLRGGKKNVGGSN